MAATFISIASNFISCPLNPSFTKEEFKFYFKDLDLKVVIIEENKSTLAREAAFVICGTYSVLNASNNFVSYCL